MTFAALWLECTPSTSSIPAPPARTGSYYVPQRPCFWPQVAAKWNTGEIRNGACGGRRSKTG